MHGFLILFLLSVVLASSGLMADVADKRVRSYVSPKRVVWQSPESEFEFNRWRWKVTGAESLLEKKFGQIPEGGCWAVPKCRLENKGVAPGLLLDFGREINGGVELGCGCGTSAGCRVRLRFGESAGEAMSNLGEKGSSNDHSLRDGTYDVPAIGSITIGETGFRFIRIDLVSAGTLTLDSVRAVSLMRPMKRIGAFRCSDERLNRVWETAVDTVHLCCQGRLWDGIKRDRIVWMGDTHPETMAILTVFGKASVLPETLDYVIAVTDPKEKWMNTIATYTMWFVRNMAEWYRYTGDVDYVRRHLAYLDRTVDRLISRVEADGVFRTTDRTILDWPTEHNTVAKNAGMQGLLASAFDEGAFMAEGAGDAALAKKCREAAARVKAQPKPDPNGSKQAAALLALSGMTDAREMYDKVLGTGGHDGVSTFYGYYMLEAMSRAGENQRALDTVRDYWGAMLDVGATSFWENFNLAWTNNCTRLDELPVPGKKDIHGDYGEFCYPGYRHSLCHAWSAGPAAWLINHVLGIRPLLPGCRKVEVKPFLGNLERAEGAMALPDGNAVRVRVEKRPDGTVRTEVDAPGWVEIVR